MATINNLEQPTMVGDRDTDTSAPKPRTDPERSREMAGYWKEQIQAYDQLCYNWFQRGEAINRRYRNERDKAQEDGARNVAALWTWFQIMKPAVYGKVPQAVVERKFLDKDPVGRMSAQILERGLRNELEINGFDAAMNRLVQDFLLVGRGVAWVRYEAETGPSESLPPTSGSDMENAAGELLSEDDSEETEKLEDTNDQIIRESAPVDFIHWKDLYILPARARTWSEVQAVGKKTRLSKSECIKKWPDVGDQIEADPNLSQADRTVNTNTTIFQDINERKRTVFEIWNKSDRKVYWVSEGYDYLIDAKDDFLELEGFFPTPEPLSAVMTNDTMVPVPFYIEWEDQAKTLDELTQKINLLTKALRVAGVYDSSVRNLQRLLNESSDNELIPVDNWAVLTGEGKGLEGVISFLPIKEVAEVLQITIDTRDKILEDLDRVTGISDVLRGTTDARETLGAQRLKANSATTRVEDLRKDVARYARDLVRLTAEVMSRHFSNETLIETSGILYEEELNIQQQQPQLPSVPSPPTQPALPAPTQPPGQPQMAPGQPGLPAPTQPPGLPVAQPQPSPLAAIMPMLMAMQKVQRGIELLRQDIPRGYRIDIEIDSMIGGDAAQERQDATEFLQAVTEFVEKAGMIVQQNPAFAPLAGKMLQFGVRKFRTGRDLEAAIDEYVDQITKQAAQPKPAQPNPEQIKAQSEQMKAQAEITKAQLDAKAAQANDQREAQLNQQDLQAKMMEMQMRLKEMQMHMQQMQAEHSMKMTELAAQHQQKMQQHAINQQNQLMKPPTPGMQ